MKRLSVLVIAAMASLPSLGQGSMELGLSVGWASFLGDLGGSRDLGRAFVYDLDFLTTRPAVGAVYRWNVGRKTSLRANLYFAQLWGDDGYSGADDPIDGRGWSRWYRQLSFKSHILELSGMIEYNLLPYAPGNLEYRFTPFVHIGLGVFHFDPKTKINGEWVRLQPLGTEGQGLPQYPEKEKYSLIEMAFPMGAGIKYNLDRDWSINFEVSHRQTTTDYIDDVSSTYVNPVYYDGFYDPETALLASTLADRSPGNYPEKTRPGQQRGDPSDNDTYFFGGVITLVKVLDGGRGQYFCPKGFGPIF